MVSLDGTGIRRPLSYPVLETMDAQYPFASRDDIWRVLDELKDIQVAQFDQAERIARLERNREDYARMKSVWGPQSPFLPTMGGSVQTGMTPSLRLIRFTLTY